jgi:hypothetical protein
MVIEMQREGIDEHIIAKITQLSLDEVGPILSEAEDAIEDKRS